MISIASICLLLFLAGCTSAGPTSANLYLWTKRGAEVGGLARTYCLTGSIYERHVMLQALAYHALPAQVTIHCPD